jgi:hypothetical protein
MVTNVLNERPTKRCFACTTLFTILMRCSWPPDREDPKSLFYDCSSYCAPDRNRSHVPTQTALHTVERICHNPTLPKTNPAKIQLSQFLYETIVHKHPNWYQKDVDCDHPRSILARSPLVLTSATSLASLTHSLTLDCGSLRSHALSTGRKMKKYR